MREISLESSPLGRPDVNQNQDTQPQHKNASNIVSKEVPQWQRDLGIDLDLSDGEEDTDELPSQLSLGLDNSAMETITMESTNNNQGEDKVARPSRLSDTANAPKKKIVPNMGDILRDDDDDMDVTLSQSSSEADLTGISLEGVKTPDDLTTPEAMNSSVFEGELDWESGSTPVSPVEPIPEYTAREEYEDNKNWRNVQIGQSSYRIDMKVIEPYKKVLSHGGYYGDGFNALVVFAACYLPDKQRKDYQYVMDNLFLYVISTLELLVVEDYMIIYFHGSTPKQKMPGLRWLKRCYDMIDRRLRKNLKGLLIVHPTLWLKTVVLMTKPFISSKFSSKLHYVRSLQDLTKMVPTEYIYIPDEIKAFDARKNKSSSSSSSSPATPT